MNVLSHIKEEHEKFREKMSKIKSAKGNKKKLFREFYAELDGHHEAEEHVVFPLIREKVKGEDDEIVLEMIEEHSLGSYQFSVLEKTPEDNETWDAKFSVLKEVLEHHMKEEEKEFIPV
jgi:hemerythrin superfamily protein